jgi:hypothetical protein
MVGVRVCITHVVADKDIANSSHVVADKDIANSSHVRQSEKQLCQEGWVVHALLKAPL